MARSFSNAKLLSSFLVDQISLAAVVSRRGYAVASRGVASGSARKGGEARTNKRGEGSNNTSSWVPDPVTGYYRPGNHANEIDVAELREVLLNNKIRGH